ncbi:hypothetical protein PFISCL1PPCAC_23573, partial [Pristionchus fissidentatus]
IMRGLFVLFLLLILANLVENRSNKKKKQSSDCDDEHCEEPVDNTGDCIPPVVVVIFFTAYGFLLVGLYIYGAKLWIGLMEAKYKLRKMMALELALIHYDEFCERHSLHGRLELFVPASNDGFFMDAAVQEAWLSVNNLRARIPSVPTQEFQDLMRQNWDAVKR